MPDSSQPATLEAELAALASARSARGPRRPGAPACSGRRLGFWHGRAVRVFLWSRSFASILPFRLLQLLLRLLLPRLLLLPLLHTQLLGDHRTLPVALLLLDVLLLSTYTKLVWNRR